MKTEKINPDVLKGPASVVSNVPSAPRPTGQPALGPLPDQATLQPEIPRPRK
jgi:hypothetical protein